MRDLAGMLSWLLKANVICWMKCWKYSSWASSLDNDLLSGHSSNFTMHLSQLSSLESRSVLHAKSTLDRSNSVRHPSQTHSDFFTLLLAVPVYFHPFSVSIIYAGSGSPNNLSHTKSQTFQGTFCFYPYILCDLDLIQSNLSQHIVMSDLWNFETLKISSFLDPYCGAESLANWCVNAAYLQ